MHDRDDSHDEPPAGPHRPPKDNTLLIVLLAVGGLLWLGCVGVGALLMFGFTRAVQVQEVQQEAEKARQVMTREAFKKLVGMTPEEVEGAVGRPDRTEGMDGSLTWFYEDRTTDPANGKVDGTIRVHFMNGMVTEVVFD